MSSYRIKAALCASAASLALGTAAWGQVAVAAAGGAAVSAPSAAPAMQEVIVTANKRKESVDSVAASITAVTGAALARQNITTTGDLTKVTPGFNYTPSPYGQPVYLIRGVGLFESGLASSPAVTVYLDEVPLSSPIMTEIPPLDLERVEVLKGPQGTLFGQNSTGGAVNYIAAKPTETFHAGLDLAYLKYNEVRADGFVSGKISDTLNARLAIGVDEGGAWQYNSTHPEETLGDHRNVQGRVMLDWRPTDRLKFELNINGFFDGSDTQAHQLLAVGPVNPGIANPQIFTQPTDPRSPRAANYPSDLALRSKDPFAQVSLRTDYDLNSGVTITALTGFAYLNEDETIDTSGLSVPAALTGAGPAALIHSKGTIRSISQEIRAANHSGPIIWTVGAGYDHADTDDAQLYTEHLTIDQPIPFLPPLHYPAAQTKQQHDDAAIFGNIDYHVNDQLTARFGLRGTYSRTRSSDCTYDWNPAGDSNAIASIFTTFQQLFAAGGLKTTPVVAVAPSGCIALSPAPDLSPMATHNHLNESNLSYHAGLDYKLGPALVYASVSRGYKSGIISNIIATTTTETTPVKQEALQAYEIGLKTPVFDPHIRFDGAVFYYDYTDKQLRSSILDPVFGLLEKLVNIPKSRVIGVDANLRAEPIRGLTLTVGGTYLDTDVTRSFSAYNAQGAYGDFKGSQLPYTPKYELLASGQYEWPLSEQLNAFVGGSVVYHSSSSATFATASAPAPRFALNAYTLVDLQAGIGAPDGTWRLTAFGSNVTNELYATTVKKNADGMIYRTVGLPETYGLKLAYHW